MFPAQNWKHIEFFDINIRTNKQTRKEIFINDKNEMVVKVIGEVKTKEEYNNQEETDSSEETSIEEQEIKSHQNIRN